MADSRAEKRALRRGSLIGFFVALGLLVLFGLLILPGVDVWTLGLAATVRSDLATALIGGAVIGMALLGAQMAFSWQLSLIEEKRAEQAGRLEEERRRHANREALRLQLGLGKDFPRIDLSDQDLSGFYLMERDFSGAILNGVNLEGADLRGTKLAGAMLIEARLERAALVAADLSWATLYGANLSGAILLQTNMTDAGLEGPTSQRP